MMMVLGQMAFTVSKLDRRGCLSCSFRRRRLRLTHTATRRASACACPGGTPPESIQQFSAISIRDKPVLSVYCPVPPTPPAVTRAEGDVMFISFYRLNEQRAVISEDSWI